MKCEPFVLPLGGAAPDVRLQPYLLDNFDEIDSQRKRPLVIILPGGGYHFRSNREGEPVALRLMALGLSCLIVDYAVAPERFPAALLQVLATIAHARQQAEAWHIDENRIIVMGFSAGGHLAGSAGVFWSRPHYAGKLGLKPEQVRPNGLALCYPVITAGPFAHEGSMENLLGDEMYVFGPTVSLEKQANPKVPPTFLWHTWDDASVPVENSLLFATALRRLKVPTALHIFSSGVHGISLSDDQVYGPEGLHQARADCARWVSLFDDWQRQL